MKYTIILIVLLVACVENKQHSDYLCDDNKIKLDVRECISLGNEELKCKEIAQDEHCISLDF